MLDVWIQLNDLNVIGMVIDSVFFVCPEKSVVTSILASNDFVTLDVHSIFFIVLIFQPSASMFR